MQKYLKKYILLPISLLFIGVSSIFAQDVHFSQFEAAPLYYNSALTGLLDCNYRFIGNFKSQWGTYKTGMLSYDQIIRKLSSSAGTFGIGGFINADYAGETSYGNTFVKVMPAYHFSIVPGTFTLSAGVDLMLNYSSINEGGVILPGQIDPITGKPVSVPTNLESQSQTYGDIGFGINGKYMLKDNLPVFAGVSLQRILQSGGGGFAANTTQANERRIGFNINSTVPINSMISLMPSLVYLSQEKFDEMNFGTFAKFNVAQHTNVIEAIYIGSWYRVQDAIIFGIGLDKPVSTNWNLNIGISYDATVSNYRSSNKWQNSSNVRSDSFEISVKLINCRAPILFVPQGIINDPFR